MTNYIEFLQKNKQDPYWKDILNTSYDLLGSKLEIVKSEISRNRYEMKNTL